MKRVFGGMLTSLLVIGLIAALSPRTRAEDQPGTAKPTGSISGKVLDKDGKPIEKAKVRVAKAMPAKPMPAAGPHPAEHHAADPAEGKPAGPTSMPVQVETDSQGVFMVESVPVGDYTVMVTAKGLNAKQQVHVDANQTATVELKLEPKPMNKPKGK